MSLFRGAAITGALTLVSRVLGFVRDLLVARLFGASPLADAFFVAFRIPNLLRSFVAEGALNSAFVPVFVRKVSEGEAQRNAAFRQALGFVLILAGGLTLLGILFAPQIIGVIAPGFSSDEAKVTLTTDLTRIMFPLLVCVSVVAAIGGALNSLKIFGAPGVAQIAMNLVLIAGAVLAAHSERPIYTLAWSVLLGGIAQVVVQIPALRRAGLPLLPTFRWNNDVVPQICKLLLPATLGAAVYQATIFLATVFASLVGDGAVSWLFYADRLTQLPIGIFSIALASVLLPALAKASVERDDAGFNSRLELSLRWTSFILVPMSVWLWIDAEPLVRILFERGSFTARDTAMTAGAVQALTLGLWAMSCQSMITRAFIAVRDTRTPSLIGLLGLFLFVVSAFLCVSELRSTMLGDELAARLSYLPDLQHVGLAFSSSIAALFSFLVTVYIALRRFSGFSVSGFLRSTLSIFVASLGSGLVFSFIVSEFTNVHPLLAQSAGLAAMAVTYLLTLALLRSTEIADARKAVIVYWNGRKS